MLPTSRVSLKAGHWGPQTQQFVFPETYIPTTIIWSYRGIPAKIRAGLPGAYNVLNYSNFFT